MKFTIDVTEKQAKIMLELLEWHIENLIDEPNDSPRGIECAATKELFDIVYESLEVAR